MAILYLRERNTANKKGFLAYLAYTIFSGLVLCICTRFKKYSVTLMSFSFIVCEVCNMAAYHLEEDEGRDTIVGR